MSAIVMQSNTRSAWVLPIHEIFWDEDGNNADHLWERHQVEPDEVEEVVFGSDGEPSGALIYQDRNAAYAIYGRTGGGRLLIIVGEFREPGVFRPFSARDMDENQKRRFQGKGK
jgi:uncharacterized DUF497 family protein